jgi:hypothetical protein
MGYDIKTWDERYIERSDLTTWLVHLTRGTGNKNRMVILFEILDSCTLKGSTTSSGFIIGETPAVCFQDAPLHAVTQNILFEQKWRKKFPKAKIRYEPIGIALPKRYVYSQGGRPVIYDSKNKAKQYLPPDQYWRIVSFDLSDETNIIDWSHEREWRVPGDLKFNLDQVTLLLGNLGESSKFIQLCDNRKKDFYRQVGGIVTMANVFW